MLDEGKIMAKLINGNKTVVFDQSGKVVWEFKAPKFKGVHEIHVLTTNGKPTKASPRR